MSHRDASESILLWLDDKLELSQNDSVLLRLEADQPTNARWIFNKIRLGSIFCSPHEKRVRSIIESGLRIPDNAESFSELTPQRTNKATPTNPASKTPKVLSQNNSRTGKKQVERALKESLKILCKRPFTKEKGEPKSGFIYALQYTSSEHTEYLKIGYTTKAVESRAEGISQECHASVKILYKSQRVKHPSRIESLLHKQMETIRYNKPNCSCNKTHKELFRIREEDVESKVGSKVDRWAEWMNEEPYKAEKGRNGSYHFYFKSKNESSLDRVVRESIDEAMLADEMYRSTTVSCNPLTDGTFQNNKDPHELESGMSLTTIEDENESGDPVEHRESTAITDSPCFPKHAEETFTTVVPCSSKATPSLPIRETRHTKTTSLNPSRRSSVTPVARSKQLQVLSDKWRDRSFRSRPSALPTPDKTPSPGIENTKIASETEDIYPERSNYADSWNNSSLCASDEWYPAGELRIRFATLRLLTPEEKQRFYEYAEEPHEIRAKSLNKGAGRNLNFDSGQE
ncbi:hypothetical protein MMC10_002328 [Thelotrema lepadinum]|nr:hypothetical protein [Thelotrema lepadinum]